MSKHEYKVGDRVEFQVAAIAVDGDLLFERPNGLRYYIPADAVTPVAPDHSEYIGKPLADCPDWTVAVVASTSGLQSVRQLRGDTCTDFGDGWTAEDDRHPSEYTVVQILTLGIPAVKMTHAEIEAKLGHPVNVVN